MQIFYKLFYNPIKIRILNYFFGKYNIIFYPKKIKLFFQKISNNEKKKEVVFFKNIFNFERNDNKEFLDIYEKQFFCINKVNKIWNDLIEHSHAYDTEVINASHRFHWNNFILDSHISDLDKEMLIDLILLWKDKFARKKNDISWQPYNVSERICNWIVLFHFLEGKICSNKKDILADEIKDHIIFLANNLEYPSSGIINNHILNNARALFIGGLFINNIEITNFAKLIIKESYDKLFYKSGFLSESSSHYHFLITRSLFEIYIFAKESQNDNEFCGFIESRLKNAIYCCKFLLSEKNTGGFVMPKIGDVSPDIPFEWFNPFSKNGWSKLWNYNLDDFPLSFNINHQLIDGWLRLSKKNWTAFTFLHPNLNEYPSGHGHDDFASINLYYNDKPILVDIGCMSYDKKNIYFNCGRNSFDHNTLQINGKSLIEPGIGRKSMLSSKLRRKCSYEFSSESINWSGITGQNISWKRRLELFSEDKISVMDECDGNKFKFMSSYYYISNYLKLYSQNANKIIFKTKNNEDVLFEFIFDKDCEIKVEDAYFFSNYGIKENIKRIKTNIRFPKKILVLEINHIKLQK